MLDFFNKHKKFIFSLIVFVVLFLVLVLVHFLKLSDHVQDIAIISTDIAIVIVSVTYLTGQAKIDLELPDIDVKSIVGKVVS